MFADFFYNTDYINKLYKYMHITTIKIWNFKNDCVFQVAIVTVLTVEGSLLSTFLSNLCI